MNKYLKIYNLIIEKYKKNKPNTNLIYCEKHHIIPKSLGGSNDKSNLVCLPYRIHVFVHECLYKYYRESGMIVEEIKMLVALKALLNYKEISKRPRLFSSRRAWFMKNKVLQRLQLNPNFKRYQYNGESLTLEQWSKKVNIKKHTLYYRIHKYGWTIQEALTIKPNSKQSLKSKIAIDKAKIKKDNIHNKYNTIFNFLIEHYNGSNHNSNFKYISSKMNIKRSYKDMKHTAMKYCKNLIYQYDNIIKEYQKFIKCERIKNKQKRISSFSTEDIIKIFEEYINYGLEYVNYKYKINYKNKLSIENAFKCKIPIRFSSYKNDKKVIFIDGDKKYTLKQLKAILKISNKMIRKMISKYKSIDEINENIKNAQEKYNSTRLKIIIFFKSYQIGGFKQVKKDFPNCKLSPSGLRGYFERWIPDLYNPKNENYKNLKGIEITINGITKKIGVWSRESGVSVELIRKRLKRGITGDKLLYNKKINGKYYKVHGKEITIFQASKLYNIPRSNIYRMLNAGYTLEQSIDKLLNNDDKDNENEKSN